MAMIGDVLVKFVADFAEFAKGTDDSIKRLDEFGKAVEKHTGSIEKMMGQLRALALLSAAAFVIKKVVDYGLAAAEAAKEQETLAKQLGFTTDEIQAMQKASKENGATFDQTAKYYKAHRTELVALTNDMREQGKLQAEASVHAFADIATELARFEDILGRVRQQFQGGTFNTVLSTISAMIRDAGSSLAYFEVYKGTITSVRELMALFSGAGGLVGVSAAQRASEQLGELKRNAVDAEVALQKLDMQSTKPKPLADAFTGDRDRAAAAKRENEGVEDQRAKLLAARDAANAEVARVEAVIKKAEEIERKANDPKPVPKIEIPSAGGGGGKGGKTDEDSLQAQIDRFNALDAAAKRAYQTIVTNQGKGIEELQREVAVQQRIDEVVGKLGAKYAEASREKKAEFRASVEAALKDDELARKRLENIVNADELERRLGNGQRARERAARDRQRLEEGGASPEALRRNDKQVAEQLDQNARAAKRYDDSLESLGAGIESASASMARSNDLFSVGEKTFNGFIDAISESMDVLLGKSQKTFAEIAASFAKMIADMLLRAAIAQAVSAFLRFAFPAPAPTSGGITTTVLPPLPARAGGGDVLAAQSYLVGERGPERFIPDAAGTIVPAGGGTGQGAVIVNLDMKKAEGARDPASALEFGRRVKAAVMDVINNEKRPGGTLHGGMAA